MPSQLTDRRLHLKEENSSCREKKKSENEIYWILQTTVLLFFVLLFCYQSFVSRSVEYSLLESGEFVFDRMPSDRAILTFSLRYSFYYSIAILLAACMTLYSLISKEAKWSFPLIALYFADILCDVSTATFVIWVFLNNLRFVTALSYTVVMLLLIVGEIWAWLGVLGLYEYRTFRKV